MVKPLCHRCQNRSGRPGHGQTTFVPIGSMIIQNYWKCLSLLCHATDCIANWSIYCLRLLEHVVLCVFTSHTLLHHDAWQNYECHYRINSIRTWIRLWSIYCLRLSERVILCVFTTYTLVAKLYECHYWINSLRTWIRLSMPVNNTGHLIREHFWISYQLRSK